MPASYASTIESLGFGSRCRIDPDFATHPTCKTTRPEHLCGLRHFSWNKTRNCVPRPSVRSSRCLAHRCFTRSVPARSAKASRTSAIDLPLRNCTTVSERILIGNCPERTFTTPQQRHTVDQIVAKLRKADGEIGKAKTHSSAASVASGLMWIGVRVWTAY